VFVIDGRAGTGGLDSVSVDVPSGCQNVRYDIPSSQQRRSAPRAKPPTSTLRRGASGAPTWYISALFVTGQKRYRKLPSERPVLWALTFAIYPCRRRSFSARQDSSYYAAAGVASPASVSQ
jgi:hypothetical protein